MFYMLCNASQFQLMFYSMKINIHQILELDLEIIRENGEVGYKRRVRLLCYDILLRIN